MKGNFLVLLPPLHDCRKDSFLHFSIFSVFRPSFLSSFASVRGAPPSPRFVVIRESAHTSQSPRIGRSHSFTMPARCCFVFTRWLRSSSYLSKKTDIASIIVSFYFKTIRVYLIVTIKYPSTASLMLPFRIKSNMFHVLCYIR